MTSIVDLCCGSPPQRRSTLGRMSRGDGRGRSFLSPSQQRTDLNDDILDMDLLLDTVPARNMPVKTRENVQKLINSLKNSFNFYYIVINTFILLFNLSNIYIILILHCRRRLH